jgi:hypothetical protein
VVLVSLGLGRLRLPGLCRALAAAIAAAARFHALAAVHPAVAVPVRAAIAVHRMTLVFVMLPPLALRHLVPGITGLTRRRGSAVLLVLAMVLVLWCGRGRLGRGRHGARKSNHADNDLHLKIS